MTKSSEYTSRFRQLRRHSLRHHPNSWRYQIFDPSSDTVLHWNRIFLASSMIALFLDPLYFYLPSIYGNQCVLMDLNMGIIVTFLRTVADLFYLGHMILKFRTAFVAPSSRVFGRGELVKNPRQIALRYLKSDFIIDLMAMLPLPQVIIWFFIRPAGISRSEYSNNTLVLIVLIQYVPRLFLIFPLNKRLIKQTGVVAKTAWTGAAYNLLLYMLASHILGASWYLLSLGWNSSCWKVECQKENGTNDMPMCIAPFFDCTNWDMPGREAWLKKTHVLSNCNAANTNSDFQYGMFADAFTDEVVSATLSDKFLYCLWWGLKNLTSYGQDLATTTYTGETLFASLICITGLVLVSHLIGNMQGYLQSSTVRREEWRIKQRDIEEWMRHRQLPQHLQERVREYMQYKWLATRGVDEESVLRSLPLDLRRDIKRHLCLALVRRVPFFSQMDDQLLDAICERLVSFLSTSGTYIIREGDPVNEMLFIIRGELESSTTNGGRSGFFNSITLRPGDFCGEELLTWALMLNSTLNLPSSTRTVRALCEVEAFALRAEDLKFVAKQFKRLHSKKLQHAFRYYSHQWRAWGACFIEAAWRRYKKRKLAKELAKQESLLYLPMSDLDQASYFYDVPLDTGADTSPMENPNNINPLGATILASRFAHNTKRGVNQKIRQIGTGRSMDMPKLVKPEEPDFYRNGEDGD